MPVTGLLMIPHRQTMSNESKLLATAINKSVFGLQQKLDFLVTNNFFSANNWAVRVQMRSRLEDQKRISHTANGRRVLRVTEWK